MNLVCIKEAISSTGKKLMQFTKGEKYTAVFYSDKMEGEWYEVIDDNLKKEVFFDLGVMFEKV